MKYQQKDILDLLEEDDLLEYKEEPKKSKKLRFRDYDSYEDYKGKKKKDKDYSFERKSKRGEE